MMNRAYIDAVRLLLEVAPEIFREPIFALEGGTAINLSLHDMPRLSVDLDLVYTDHQPGRDEALQHIGAALTSAATTPESRNVRCERGSSAEETKLFLERNRVRVKIEVNHVFRGTVLQSGSPAVAIKDRAVAPPENPARQAMGPKPSSAISTAPAASQASRSTENRSCQSLNSP